MTIKIKYVEIKYVGWWYIHGCITMIGCVATQLMHGTISPVEPRSVISGGSNWGRRSRGTGNAQMTGCSFSWCDQELVLEPDGSFRGGSAGVGTGQMNKKNEHPIRRSTAKAGFFFMGDACQRKIGRIGYRATLIKHRVGHGPRTKAELGSRRSAGAAKQRGPGLVSVGPHLRTNQRVVWHKTASDLQKRKKYHSFEYQGKW